MPAPRSSSGSSKGSGRSRSGASKRDATQRGTSTRGTSSATKSAASRRNAAAVSSNSASDSAGRGVRAADGLSGFVEQLVNRIIRPLGIVMLTRDRIQETLDEAAARGRVTHTDANDLVTELVSRGREQTDELLSDLERLFDSASKRVGDPVDRLVRTADRARRSIGVGPSFPILGYDDLTASQVEERLDGLSRAELRRVREYELRHANRKSVLAAIERALA